MFNQLNPAPIANNSTAPAVENPSGLPEFGLKVAAGESLTLLGGNISLDGGGLVALGGRVEIGGLSQPGTVTYNADGSLGFPTGVARSDVSLTNRSRINAVGNGGSITMNAGALEVLDSVLSAGIGSNSGFVGAQAGNITLNASAVRVGDRAIVANLVRDGGIGNAGDIRITTDSLSLTNVAQLDATSLGQGNAGDVIIHARDRVSLTGVNPLDSVPSAIFSSVGASNANTVAVGNGGDIRISTGSLSLTNGAQLSASTGRREQGRGGDVSITADSVRLVGGSIFSSTRNRFPGGTVTLNANTFEATGGSQINTASDNQGRAGDIILNVSDRITLSGVTNDNSASLQGAASGLYASTARGSAAPGGTIQITTDQLQVLDQARIAVDSQGSGIGGDIDITASSMQLDDRARITAETVATDGGNIELRDVELLRLDNNSRIITTAGTDRAGGNGGNIDIDATFIVAFPNANSDIQANAFTGRGGTVDITTEGLFGIAAQPQDNPLTSDITASSEQGVQGTVNITTPDVDPRRGLGELPVTVVDASDQITQICPGLGGRGETGEFVVTGRGGLPPSPIDSLIGEESLTDWNTLDEEDEEGEEDGEAPSALPDQNSDTASAPIVEAQGWVVGEDGNVNLIAAAPASTVQPPAICP